MRDVREAYVVAAWLLGNKLSAGDRPSRGFTALRTNLLADNCDMVKVWESMDSHYLTRCLRTVAVASMPWL